MPVAAATFKWQQLLAVSLVREGHKPNTVQETVSKFLGDLAWLLDRVTGHMSETELVDSRFICNCGWTCLKFKSNLCLHVAVYYEA